MFLKVKDKGERQIISHNLTTKLLGSSVHVLFFLSAQGIVGSIFEVLAITVFVYFVLPGIPSGIGILLLCGVFSFRTLVDIKMFWNQNKNCQMKPNKEMNKRRVPSN